MNKREGQRGAEVLVLFVQSLKPGRLLRTIERLDRLSGEREVVG
jgi:hypothetical protein